MSNTTPVRQQQCNMIKVSKNRLNHFLTSLAGSNARFYAFAGFMTLVFFTGGGSRDDIQSLIILRPLAVLFGAYALTVMTRERWEGRLFPLCIALSLAVLMILQLIPLPPDIWTELPGRKIFADTADLAGIEQPWRPLTLSPSRTLNSLYSLAVPITAIMLYLNLDRNHKTRTIPTIIILCTISALWATIQLVGSSRGPLYLYQVTNFGFGVGLFANRNHQSVMLAVTIIMLGWYAGTLRPNINRAAMKHYFGIAAILVFVPLIFVTGSRAGLLLMVPALVLASLFIYAGGYHSGRSQRRGRGDGKKKKLFAGRRIILTTSVVAIAGISLLPILFSRSLALDRLFIGNGLEEFRVQLIPTLLIMIKDYAPWGSGFGSFEYVYKIYELPELLRPQYLNQAHNDWLQYPIEGGVPALLIAAVACIWFTARLWLLVKNLKNLNRSKYRGLMCLAVMLFLLAASIGDYPLRVPSIIAVFSVLVCVFNDSIRSVQHRDIN